VDGYNVLFIIFCCFQVQTVPLQRVLNENAYVLFYSKATARQTQLGHQANHQVKAKVSVLSFSVIISSTQIMLESTKWKLARNKSVLLLLLLLLLLLFVVSEIALKAWSLIILVLSSIPSHNKSVYSICVHCFRVRSLVHQPTVWLLIG
jgi:hypothetical protein